jgi:hypothetical protein
MEKILSSVLISDDTTVNEYTCLWDTGSMETVISEKVLNDLSLTKNGHVIIKTIHSEKKSDKYNLKLILSGHSKSIKINCACFGKSREFDVVIGMDIINHGLLIIDHGVFSFKIDKLL